MARKKKTASREELQQLHTILDRWQRAVNYTNPVFQKGKDWYFTYRAHRDPTSHHFKYNSSTPLVFTIVENMVSTIMNTIFASDNTVLISSVEPFHQAIRPDIDDQAIATQLTRVLNWYLKNPDNEFFVEIHDLIKNVCIFGTSYSTVLPKFDYSEMDAFGNPKYLGPSVECRDFFDVIPDPQCHRLNKGRWVFLREIVSYDELRRREEEENYYNIDHLSNENYIPEDFRSDILHKLGRAAQREYGVDEKNGQILLIHYFRSGHIVTIAGNWVIVRDTRLPQKIQTELGEQEVVLEPYPYDIFDDIRLWSVPKEFYGIGISEIAKKQQDDINLLRSMRFENIALSLQKPFIANPLFDVDIDNIVFAPGNIILANDIDRAVKQLDVRDVTNNSFQEEAIFKNDAQDSTGSFETMRGGPSSRREAATTILHMERGGFKRIETFLKYMSLTWFRSVAKKIMVQLRTYLPQTEYERICGQPDAGFYSLTNEEISRMFDLSPSSNNISQLKELEQQTFIQAYQVLAQQGDIVNRQELARYFFELFMPHLNPDRFFLQPATPGTSAQEQMLRNAQNELVQQQGAQGGIQSQAPIENPAQIGPEEIVKLIGGGG